MKTVEVLRAARELISDPERWTRHAVARDADGGLLLNGNDPRACQWSAEGAVGHVTGCSIDQPGALSAINALSRAAKPLRPSRANDIGTHAEVLAMFDKAIALAEADDE